MSAENKTHDALVNRWQENAKEHDDENYWFLRSLKLKSIKKVDRISLELHHEAFSIVDCTKCAQLLPHTDKKDFASSSMNHANNALVCLAVFYLVEEMKKRLRGRSSSS